MSIKRRWDKATKEEQDKCVREVISRIEEMETSEVGIIAAQDVIDIVLENLAPAIYNAGLHDANKLLRERLSDVEAELELLEAHS